MPIGQPTKRPLSSVTAVPPPNTSHTATAPNAETRRESIATAAYYKSLARGFVPGYELDDWLAAEREIEAALAKPRN